MKKLMLAVGAAAMAAACLAGEICVEGRGTVSVAPDMMRLRFDVEAIDMDMAKSAEMFGEKSAAVTRALLAAGVASNEVTTSGIEMEPLYHHEDKDGNDVGRWGKGKRVFDGYCHSTEVTFAAPLDRERLEKIYRVVVGCKTGTEMNLDFFVKDTNGAKARARRLAVENARDAASELTAAAGVALGEPEKIVYTSENESDSFGAAACCEMKSFGPAARDGAPVLPAIRIRDIEISDRVVITWKLK